MNNIYEIQNAKAGDIDELVKLFDEYRIFYKQKSDLKGAKIFLSERFEKNDSVIFIAKDPDNDRAIGFAQLYPCFSSVSMKSVWILNDLFVKKEFRNRGVAKKLLDSARDHAKKTKSKGLQLSTVSGNEKAQRLYEKNDYTRDDEYIHYYNYL